MAGIKIADLYAQIGVKVDSSKLQTFLVKLSAVKMRVNQLSAALNNANRSMSNSYGMQSAAERLKAAQHRTIAAQYAAQAAASRAAAAAARTANVRQPRSPQGGAGSAPRARVGVGTGGINAGGLLALPASLVASLGGVYALTSSFVNVNKQVDNFKAGMLLSSGSASAANQQIAWLKTQTQELGVAYRGATQDFTQFSATSSAMGATSSQTRVMYSDILKIQSALSMTPDQAEGMTRALTQMVSKGKVMSEELKGQLAERVPGAVAIMAKAMGKTVPELFEMMKDGALDATEAVPKFLEMYAKLAQDSGALAQAQGGLSASLNNLDSAWFSLMEAMGDAGIKKILKSGLDWLTKVIQSLTNDMGNIKQLFIDVYDNAVRFGQGVLNIARIVGIFAIAMGAAAIAIWVFNGGILTLLSAGIGALVGLFASLGSASFTMAAGFWSTLVPIIALGMILSAIFLLWQDLTSEDSWLLNWANDANLLQKAVTFIYDAFTSLIGVIDTLSKMSLPDFMLTLLKYSPAGLLAQAGATVASNLLPSGQAAAAGGSNTTTTQGSHTYNIFGSKNETAAETVNGLKKLEGSAGNTSTY